MKPNPKAGDLVFFRGPSVLSKVIYLGSGGWPGYSHVGIIGDSPEGLVMFESTSTLPETERCILQGCAVKGVQAHKLSDVLDRREDKVWHVPLTRSLYDHERTRLRYYLGGRLGTGYDFHGAVRSGGLVLWALEKLIRREDLSTIFCSELVAAALSAVGVFPTSKPGSYSPNRLAKVLRFHGLTRQPIRIK